MSTMLEYRFAKTEEMPDVIDLIDLVFSQVAIPHDFEVILPKCYGQNRDYSHVHAIALREGKVRGALGCYPVTQVMQDEVLKAGYLGSMAVHRHERGAGLMKVLMQMQIDRAKETGLDMLLLGGQRQRYQYHGFYPCGGNYSYYLSPSCIRHGLRDVEPTLAFEKLEKPEHVAYALALYKRQAVSGYRSADDFVDACKSYWSQPWIILKDEKPVGYLVSSNKSDNLTELLVEDESLLPQVIKAWCVCRNARSVHVTAYPWVKTRNRFLAGFAEGYSHCNDSMMMLLLNPERVIRAYLKLKTTLEPVQDGTLVLKLADHPALAIRVQGGKVSVTPTDAPPDLALSMEEGVHLLFARNRFYAPEVSTPAGWFPLPMSVAVPDTF